MADTRDSNTVPKVKTPGAWQPHPTNPAHRTKADERQDLIRRLDENETRRLFAADATLDRIRVAIGAAETDSPSEIATAVDDLARTHAAMIEAKRPQNEAEAMMATPTEVWRDDRDQERRRLWVHVAEKVAASDITTDKTAAGVWANQVLADFDAAFPEKP